LDQPQNIAGPALEGLVVQNLKAWTSYRKMKEEIYYWRTKAGNEVDIVIYGPQTFLAIEVKNTSKINRQELSGLRSFKEDYPSSKCLFLYMGKSREKHGEIECIPAEEFLLDLSI
jgi:predicted AAA+ superfamily ATPase